MEKNINFIVKENENNLRIDVVINKREGSKSTDMLISKNFSIILQNVSCPSGNRPKTFGELKRSRVLTKGSEKFFSPCSNFLWKSTMTAP